jgi:hypothetical protein
MRIADALPEPPTPEQVSVKLKLPAVLVVTAFDPEIA